MPQQRRAQLTRRAIVLAAAEEFDRAGYDATPLSAILRRGEVTKGAFYFHFASKEALALALVEVQHRRWPKLQRSWLSKGMDPLSVAVGMVNDAARLIDQDVVIRAGTRLAEHRIAAGNRHHGVPDWEPLLRTLLQRSAVDGLLRPGVDPAAIAHTAYAGMIGARVLTSERHGPGMAARMEDLWQVTLQGVASPEWLRSKRPRS